jgi:mRNA-degrading endonuclease RelE of RelBE toxin-antitoxin system
MGTPLDWRDWLTDSFFRIRVAPAALEKLVQLPSETQQRLKQMVQDIAELADLVPPDTSRGWERGIAAAPLQLQIGKVDVLYSIDEASRTLAIEYVHLPARAAFDSTG